MGEKIRVIREELKKLSAEVAPLVKDGKFETINEAIISVYYRGNEHSTFNTYKGWKQAGYQVKKGAKSFHIWSRPLDVLEAEKKPETETPGEEGGRYFPVAFIFSNAQVIPFKDGDDNRGGKVVSMREHGQKKTA